MLRVMYSGSGSSPRARGTAGSPPSVAFGGRFIPACAGNSSQTKFTSSACPVHPRVRGEQLGTFNDADGSIGSSPRARGTGHHPQPGQRRHRFIPACAGNRRATIDAAANISVHPRVRGEQAGRFSGVRPVAGSSPRARGTDGGWLHGVPRLRFIPACAGNRTCTARAPGWVSVHPRVRGEQRGYHINCLYYAGSSPRARGTARNLRRRRAAPRFIPACAGNRAPSSTRSAPAPVHPRVRGEQGDVERCHAARVGSSPRARGTGPQPQPHRLGDRFIPACAGNSAVEHFSHRSAPVHPRVRGEQLPSRTSRQ